MSVTINGTTGIANVDGSAASPAFRNTDANSGIAGSADQVVISTAGTERLRVASAGQLGIGGANYGTDGYVLTSTGASSAPAWEAAGGGAFSKVYKSNSSTSTTMDSSNDPVRVGGTGCEVVLTPPAATTSYLLMFHTGLHIGDDDGQWGIQFRVSSDNWGSNTAINFMHNAYGCEDNEKWRGQRTYMKEWKPGNTSEWKIGVWASVWSSDAIDVTFNSHSGQSQLTVFELNDSGKSGDWG